MIKEKRYINLDTNNLSIRIQKDESGIRKLIGYGSVFNVKSKLISNEFIDSEYGYRTFYEIIEPTAFNEVIDKVEDVVVSVDHDFTRLLGRTKSGTAQLFIDDKGLRFEVIIPNTTLGNDVVEMVERGDFYECSFIFSVNKEGQRWDKDEDGMYLRYISNVSGLYDCTICSFHGAYSQTDIEIATRTLKEFEEVIKENQVKAEEKAEEVIELTDEEEKYKLELDLFLFENENN